MTVPAKVIDNYFVVQVLRHWSSLAVLGLPLSGHAGAPGCVGFLPVFESRAAAVEWRNEHSPTSAIAEITRAESPA